MRNLYSSSVLCCLLLISLFILSLPAMALTKVKWFPYDSQAFLQIGGGDNDALTLAKLMNVQPEAGYKNIDLFDGEFHLLCANNGDECSIVFTANSFTEIDSGGKKIAVKAFGQQAQAFHQVFHLGSDQSLVYESANGRLRIYSNSNQFEILYQE